MAEFNLSPAILNNPKFRNKDSEYILSDELRDAVEVALFLKQPLLLTGSPGTGKTRLAYKLAYELNAKYPNEYQKNVLEFHTKTSSNYTDLFYHYDALAHFYEANFKAKTNNKEEPKAENHIDIRALGRAIMMANEKNLKSIGALKGFEEVDNPIGSVVLIDEIDKAPMDFTNDLLNELDNFRFEIRETGAKYVLNEPGVTSKNVFIILTSNSDKSLPAAFLRRCVYFNIDPPGKDLLLKIVKLHFQESDNEGETNLKDDLLEDYINQFEKISNICNKKRPTTAELCNWIYFLKNDIEKGKKFKELEMNKRQASISILAKDENDWKDTIAELSK